jgi:hypothetical protein
MKFAIPIILFAEFALKLKENKISQGIIWLGLLPVFNFAMVPAVSFTVVILILVFRKHEDLKGIIKGAVVFFATVILIFLIYQSGLSTGVARDAVKVSGAFNNLLQNTNELGTVLKIMIAGIISAPACLLLWTLPWIIKRNPMEADEKLFLRRWIFAFAAIITGGSIAWALLNQTLNSVQLLSISSRVYILFLAFLLPYYLKHKIPAIAFFVLLISGTLLSFVKLQDFREITLRNSPEKTFISSIYRQFVKDPKAGIGFIRDTADYRIPFNCYPHFSIPVAGLAAFSDDMIPLSLGEGDCIQCREVPKCIKGLELGLMHQRSAMQASNGICGMMKAYDIRYLILGRNREIPDCGLAQLIDSDENTGLRFYRIDPD